MSLYTAIKIAEANPVKGLPRMAAIIKVKNKIIAVGLNSKKTHPFQKKFGRNKKSICLHAEIAAINNALKSVKDLSNAVIYVARVKKDGSTGLAKPCKGCQRAIVEFGIKNVYYTK